MKAGKIKTVTMKVGKMQTVAIKVTTAKKISSGNEGLLKQRNFLNL